MFYLLILRGRGEGQRERGRERISGRLCAAPPPTPDVGLDLMNCDVTTCAKIKNQTPN